MAYTHASNSQFFGKLFTMDMSIDENEFMQKCSIVLVVCELFDEVYCTFHGMWIIDYVPDRRAK